VSVDSGTPDLTTVNIQLRKSGSNIGSTVHPAADGKYTITGAPSGTYTIEVSLTDYDTGTIAAFSVSRTNVSNRNIKLTLSPILTYTVSGTVSVDSGTPDLTTANIQLKKDGDNIDPAVHPAADGTYTITDVPDGTYTIEVRLAGYDTETIAAFDVSGNNVRNRSIQLTIVYLPAIGSENIYTDLNTQATIRLPYIDADPSGMHYYFQNFIIYYRIYISDIEISGQISTDNDLQRINAGLYSDYWYLNPYTTLDNNLSPSAMGSVFAGRRFYSLEIEDASIDSMLAVSSGITLILDFAQQSGDSIPTLTINNGLPYRLARHYDPALTMPIPTDRYFINSSDIQNPLNISTDNRTNLDVQNKDVSGPKYTYTVMYILLFGRSPQDASPVYSAPTFIGIFRLPD
jgi:hypothetical protein